MAVKERTLEPETEFLDQALELAHELVTERDRLGNARCEHDALLSQREDALAEGIDLLPAIRQKHFEIDKLTNEISQREHHIYWLLDRSLTKTNTENNRLSGQCYIKNRDSLRRALEQFREALASVLRDVQASSDLGSPLTDPHNAKLAHIERILGGVHFPRVSFQILPLPPINAELVRRNQLIAALDNWIAGLL